MRKSLAVLNTIEIVAGSAIYAVHSVRTKAVVDEATDDAPKPVKVLDKIGQYVEALAVGAGWALWMTSANMMIDDALNKRK